MQRPYILLRSQKYWNRPNSSDKTETHVESIPANVFRRELLRQIISGFVVCHSATSHLEYL